MTHGRAGRSSGGHDRHRAARSRVTVDVVSLPVLSYALAHNRSPSSPGWPSPAAVRRSAAPRCASASATPRARSRDTVELLADLDEGRTTVLTDLGLVMDPAAMLQVEEQRPGVIDVEVEQRRRAARRGQPRGPGAGRAAVAGHSPAAGAGDARRLRACPTTRRSPRWWPRRPTCCEQQTGSRVDRRLRSRPERVDEVVRAICEAMQRRRIRYSEPPASWTDLGQQVRTPGDVLDLAGRHPPGHRRRPGRRAGAGRHPAAAVAGATGTRSSATGGRSAALSRPRTTDVADARQPGRPRPDRAGRDHPAHRRRPPWPFDAELHRPPYTTWLTGDLDRIIGVIDVRRPGATGIVPLPAPARDADGIVQVFEYRAGRAQRAGAGAEPAAAAGRRRRGRSAPPRIAAVEERAARPQPAQPADQLTPTAAASRSPCPTALLGALEDLVHDGTPVTLLPSDQLAAVQRNAASSSARDLPAGPAGRTAVERQRACTPTSPPATYRRRLRALAYKAKTVRRGDRRQQPLPGAGQPGCGSSTAGRCARRWCWSRSP